MVDVIYIKLGRVKTNTRINEIENTDELCRKFNKWMNVSEVGDKFCYFTGPNIVGKSVGRLAFRAYENGYVDLFQQKDGKNYSYLAQKRIRWE
jgi:hypothetical protein